MAPDSFNEAHLEQLAREDLARKPRELFIQLFIYGEKGGAPLPKPDHFGYDYWRRFHDSLTKSANEFAEMIAIGNDAVLRCRKSDSKMMRKVLSGTDPLRLKEGSDDFEIVYVAFSTPSRYTFQGIDAYIRTTATLKPEIGLELLKRLRPMFPALGPALKIRNDTWFVYQSSYPFVNPFVEDEIPPSEAEHDATRTLVCGSWPTPTSCRFE